MKRITIEADRKGQVLKSTYAQKRAEDFLKFIREVQNTAEKRGLTEEILNEILNGKD
ncbi:hypothetical protein [Pedobacter hiemivivus]|uniref:hypothetical protein n=1 Tax=Pedobacter hiemivivus TaxID=2530454 RepID=UPI0013F173D1|nr:hypothetical protein [Pedobacter hiemivivus]